MDSGISIHLMQKPERKAALRVMRRAFPAFMRLFMSVTPHTLVAVRGDAILGGVTMKLFSLGQTPDGRRRKAGLIYLLYVDPAVQHEGIGKQLIDEAIPYLEALGCEEIFASVEGYNPSSANIFQSRGFVSAAPGQDIRQYRFSYPAMIFGTFHYLDIGHFLWRKPGTERKASSFPQWAAALILSCLAFFIASWRWGSLKGEYAGTVLAASVISISLFYLVRTVFMVSAARLAGLPVRFRLWESGLMLSTLIALAFGGTLFAPGSWYPARNGWRLSEERKRLGLMGLAACWGTIILFWLGLLSERLALLPLPQTSHTIFHAVFTTVGMWMAIIGILLPVFPFTAYEGRRVWVWNRPLWLLTAAAAAGAVIVRIWF